MLPSLGYAHTQCWNGLGKSTAIDVDGRLTMTSWGPP